MISDVTEYMKYYTIERLHTANGGGCLKLKALMSAFIGKSVEIRLPMFQPTILLEKGQ